LRFLPLRLQHIVRPRSVNRALRPLPRAAGERQAPAAGVNAALPPTTGPCWPAGAVARRLAGWKPTAFTGGPERHHLKAAAPAAVQQRRRCWIRWRNTQIALPAQPMPCCAGLSPQPRGDQLEGPETYTSLKTRPARCGWLSPGPRSIRHGWESPNGPQPSSRFDSQPHLSQATTLMVKSDDLLAPGAVTQIRGSLRGSRQRRSAPLVQLGTTTCGRRGPRRYAPQQPLVAVHPRGRSRGLQVGPTTIATKRLDQPSARPAAGDSLSVTNAQEWHRGSHCNPQKSSEAPAGEQGNLQAA